jgi:peptide/nickel transport system permease protein
MSDAARGEPAPAPRTFWGDVRRQFRRHRGAMAGLYVFVSIILIVVFGPSVWTVDPETLDFSYSNAGPSWVHPLGTDELGRDTLAWVLAGGRTSLLVGVVAMLISIFLGTLIGLLAGYFRSLDGPLMRLTDLFLALPIVPLLLVATLVLRDTLRAWFGLELGVFLLIVTMIGVTSWMQTARIVRGSVLAVKEREFVLAARSIGTRQHRILLRHILPNVSSPIMVAATLDIANAIITESVLSFLGLGFPPDFPTWGRLVYEGVTYISVNPMRVIWPGLFIALTVLSVNFMGDGLRDALDPRIRGR